ncbi:hypothetical protein [Cytobacillus purgationiresistens]|uniref:Uncharacterized protein n=1 Tax=Cytobacillus purgationiresistens TaxID=863449 RepID=A0ABU0ATD3_9BACI|nr:hypothetical protein [Cytobacillus purgationiresistens]MDQ0273693.1 hypothetical protein [Cytobacillus purgationiresistens]
METILAFLLNKSFRNICLTAAITVQDDNSKWMPFLLISFWASFAAFSDIMSALLELLDTA